MAIEGETELANSPEYCPSTPRTPAAPQQPKMRYLLVVEAGFPVEGRPDLDSTGYRSASIASLMSQGDNILRRALWHGRRDLEDHLGITPDGKTVVDNGAIVQVLETSVRPVPAGFVPQVRASAVFHVYERTPMALKRGIEEVLAPLKDPLADLEDAMYD
ncbi:MAG: hypothetical protein V1735_06440 [Nanoarchaeota archaeon]